jgi:DNA (cytosine-5)-methyltransferase 1
VADVRLLLGAIPAPEALSRHQLLRADVRARKRHGAQSRPRGRISRADVGTDAMKYLSVCSGIEAASVAWHSMGWEPVAFSEIDPFASAVLAARYPQVPNLGTMENYREWNIKQGAIDVLVGGTPCQSFSVAGLRRGLDDPRGNLALVYLGLVDRFRPRYIVWENVPGVLSSSGGRDFGAFIGALAQLGYGFAWRVLDAQWCRVDSHPRAVPQRRRRVFVVGCAGGDAQRAASILLEPDGVRGNPPTRGQAGQGVARRAASGAPGGSKRAVSSTVARALTTSCQRLDSETETLIPFDTTQITSPANRSQPHPGDSCHPLARGAHAPAVAFQWPVDIADPVTANEGATYTHEGSRNFRMHNVVPATMAVRRLTPRECERLQGFPDDWTAITYRGKPAADGPRYKALGNSMAVNVMRWIGLRIAQAQAT